jgi:hypothetical protein
MGYIPTNYQLSIYYIQHSAVKFSFILQSSDTIHSFTIRTSTSFYLFYYLFHSVVTTIYLLPLRDNILYSSLLYFSLSKKAPTNSQLSRRYSSSYLQLTCKG